jgi:NNP family nitrate/nitrite transporter-like MFS transporter
MPNRQLAVGTISFAICFAAWGLISAFAPRFREIHHLNASQTALLIAVPVLLGSLARLPMGLLTDRLKGRGVFSALLLFSAIPAALIPVTTSFTSLVAVAFLLGMAGSSFAVGVGFVSPWFPKEKQGSALGIYGLGNAGQSAVVFLGPLLAARIGWENVFRGLAGVLVIWAIVFAAVARNAPVEAKRKSLGDMLALLARERLAWVLGAFYFLTFGGFVAFSIYLPSLLKQEFGLSAPDAGFRAAGLYCSRPPCVPSGASSPIASAAHACSRSSFSARFRSRCSWSGPRCCRLPSVRSVARPCWELAMAPSSNWSRSISPPRPAA